MTRRGDLSGEDDAAAPLSPDQARPIPDGGLSSSMPAWLKQPPAWKRHELLTTARAIPPPDTSGIDPRTLLEIDDLPQWLQAVARRETSQEAQSAGEQLTAVQSERVNMGLVDSNDEPARASHKSILSRARIEPDVAGPDDPVNAIPHSWERLTMRDERTRLGVKQPWWMSDGVIGGLLVAFILTMLYVLLVATGVL